MEKYTLELIDLRVQIQEPTADQYAIWSDVSPATAMKHMLPLKLKPITFNERHDLEYKLLERIDVPGTLKQEIQGPCLRVYARDPEAKADLQFVFNLFVRTDFDKIT